MAQLGQFSVFELNGKAYEPRQNSSGRAMARVSSAQTHH